MSVIAWDSKSVAADSLVICGGYRGPLAVQKIKRKGGRVYGITGYAAWFDAWIEWYEQGADPRAIPITTIQAESSGCFLMFEGARGFACTPDLPYMLEMGAPDAWGSGCDFAIGAMKRGANARQAVAIAIECSPNCGEPIVVMDLHEASSPAVLLGTAQRA